MAREHPVHTLSAEQRGEVRGSSNSNNRIMPEIQSIRQTKKAKHILMLMRQVAASKKIDNKRKLKLLAPRFKQLKWCGYAGIIKLGPEGTPGTVTMKKLQELTVHFHE